MDTKLPLKDLSESDSDRRNWDENGKSEINSLLWALLPGSVTLDTADRIAMEIHDLIEDQWTKNEKS